MLTEIQRTDNKSCSSSWVWMRQVWLIQACHFNNEWYKFSSVKQWGLHTHSGAARWHHPPPLNHIFPYQHCFVYVNHNENETTELHQFSHFRCNPSAKVGKLLLKLSKGCLDAHHPSAPACRPRPETLEWFARHLYACCCLGEKSCPLFFASAGSCISAIRLLPPPIPCSHHLWFLCFLWTHSYLCITHTITQKKGQVRHYSSWH